MKLVDKTIHTDELNEMSMRMFGGMVKAVVDVKKEIMVVDSAMHADEEKFLLEKDLIKTIYGELIYIPKLWETIL